MDCYDCVHSSIKGGKLKCSRTGNVVEDRETVCGSFAGSDANVCEDCEYYEFGAFSRWNTNGKCSLTGKSRKNDDVACSRFS